jgi:hypothetical protein
MPSRDVWDIDKRKFLYIPPRHASFECAIGDGSDGRVWNLSNTLEKVNFWPLSWETRQRHVDLKRIILIEWGDVTSDSCIISTSQMSLPLVHDECGDRNRPRKCGSAWSGDWIRQGIPVKRVHHAVPPLQVTVLMCVIIFSFGYDNATIVHSHQHINGQKYVSRDSTVCIFPVTVLQIILSLCDTRTLEVQVCWSW